MVSQTRAGQERHELQISANEGERLSSLAVQSPVITLEDFVLVVATKQEGKMIEKKSFEDEKKRFKCLWVYIPSCKSFTQYLRHVLEK